MLSRAALAAPPQRILLVNADATLVEAARAGFAAERGVEVGVIDDDELAAQDDAGRIKRLRMLGLQRAAAIVAGMAPAGDGALLYVIDASADRVLAKRAAPASPLSAATAAAWVLSIKTLRQAALPAPSVRQSRARVERPRTAATSRPRSFAAARGAREGLRAESLNAAEVEAERPAPETAEPSPLAAAGVPRVEQRLPVGGASVPPGDPGFGAIDPQPGRDARAMAVGRDSQLGEPRGDAVQLSAAGPAPLAEGPAVERAGQDPGLLPPPEAAVAPEAVAPRESLDPRPPGNAAVSPRDTPRTQPASETPGLAARSSLDVALTVGALRDWQRLDPRFGIAAMGWPGSQRWGFGLHVHTGPGVSVESRRASARLFDATLGLAGLLRSSAQADWRLSGALGPLVRLTRVRGALAGSAPLDVMRVTLEVGAELRADWRLPQLFIGVWAYAGLALQRQRYWLNDERLFESAPWRIAAGVALGLPIVL
ncbi:MAG: hypothetical protein ABW321_16525 [Polyangiales bacterium]